MKILAITACTAGDCPHLHCKRKAGKCSKGAGRQYKSRNTGIYWGRE